MKKFLTFILTAFLWLLPQMGEAQAIRGLALKGCTLESLRPASLRSLSGKVRVTTKNTGDIRSLKNVQAVVYRNGRKVAGGHCSDLSFPTGTATSVVSGHITLSKGVSIWEATKAAFRFKPSEYTLDVSAVMVYKDGRSSPFSFKGLRVGDYIK